MTTTDPFWEALSTQVGRTTPQRWLAAGHSKHSEEYHPWQTKYQTSP